MTDTHTRMAAASEDWLSLVQEAPLDAALPIIDAHHHLWDHPGSRYIADDFINDTQSGHNVVQSVFVECTSMYRKDGPVEMRPVGETDYVRSLADASDKQPDRATKVAAGIVGFADLSIGGAVEPVLAAHLSAGGGHFRGIRHACGWDASSDIRNSHTDPPQGLLSSKLFREGFARLDQFGLSFDAWLYHTQIHELTELASAFPDTPIILDHVGGPLGIGPYAGRRESVFEQWQRDIAELARCHNVCVKLGGLAMKICGFGWHTRDKPPTSEQLASASAPYYHYCIEQFGVERCMFESNFPVDKLSCSYGILWNSFKRVAAGCSAAERAALFHDTAARIYRLPINQ
jgi:L-fuconolactonase